MYMYMYIHVHVQACIGCIIMYMHMYMYMGSIPLDLFNVKMKKNAVRKQFVLIFLPKNSHIHSHTTHYILHVCVYIHTHSM